MTPKDLGMIRRRLNPDKRGPVMLQGCYLNAQGEILSTFHQSVGLLPQEENEKYMALFKKVLSGTAGQNLLPVTFSEEQMASDDAYALLAQMCRTELQEDQSLRAFFSQIVQYLREENASASMSVEELQKAPNVAVLLLYDSFDAPYVHSDGEEDMEMSENVFNYILCCVCPVHQGKESLSYQDSDGCFHSLPAPWSLGAPELGFMFPSYESGSADIHAAQFYTRNVSLSHEAFFRAVFHAEVTMPAEEQKETVRTLLSSSLDDECSMSVIQAVSEKVSEMIEENRQEKDAEPLQMSCRDMRRVLESAGVSEEKVQAFENQYTEVFGTQAEIPAVNVVSPKEFRVSTPSVQIRVSPDHAELVSTRVIDGKKYILVLADGDVEVNGVNVAIL